MIRLVLIVLFVLCSAVGYSNTYVYKNANIEITVEISKNVLGKETIVVHFKSLAQLLIPAENACFSFDSVYTTRCNFRNFECGFYKNGKPYYIINDVINNSYQYLPSDSTLTYEWQAPEGKMPKAFVLEMVYIPTNTKEYASNRKLFIKALIGNEGISISPGNEKVLLDRATMIITD